MTYPAASDFRIAGPHAWWLVLKNGVRRVCQMSGYSFVRILQSELRDRVRPGSETYEGGTVAGTEVVVDGRIGVNTLRALWAAARLLGASPEGLDVIRDEALASHTSGRTIMGKNVMLMAIWVLARLGIFAGVPEEISTADISLPDDAVLPYWGTAPATTAVANAFCTVLSGGTEIGPGDNDKPDGSRPVLGPDKTPPILGVSSARSPARDTTISPGILIGGLVLAALAVAAVVVTNVSEKRGSGRRRKRSR